MSVEPPARAKTRATSRARAQAPGWPLRVMMIVMGLALGLGGAEGVLRLTGTPPQMVVVDDNPALAARLAEENRTAYRTDVDAMPDRALYLETPTGKRMRANARVVIRNHHLNGRDIEVHTNELGFRNRPIGPKTKPRLLMLGDSITLADYVDEPDSFVRLVETMAQATDTPIETVNAGIGSVGLENELALLLETGLAAEPDAVLLCFYLNDVQASPGVTVAPPPAALRWSWLAWNVAGSIAFLQAGPPRSDGAREELAEWRSAFVASHPPGPGDPRRDPAAFHALVAEEFGSWGSAWSDGAWEKMKPMLEALARLSEDRDFDLMFLVLPVSFQVESEFDDRWPQERFLAIARELGVPALDPLPALRARWRAAPAIPLFFDECHFTEAGNRAMAELITPFVLREMAGPE